MAALMVITRKQTVHAVRAFLPNVDQRSVMVITVAGVKTATIWIKLRNLPFIIACPVHQLVVVAMAMRIVHNAIQAITDIGANLIVKKDVKIISATRIPAHARMAALMVITRKQTVHAVRVFLPNVDQRSVMVINAPGVRTATIWILLRNLRVIIACPVHQLVLVAMAMRIVHMQYRPLRISVQIELFRRM